MRGTVPFFYPRIRACYGSSMKLWVGMVACAVALVGCGNDTTPSGGTGGTRGSAGASGVGGNGGMAGESCSEGCTETEYCAGETCDGPGSCEERPTLCTREFNPVCACDGNTYSNPCGAAAAGARVDFEGECPCSTNDNCLDGQYCDHGTACAGDSGTCMNRPTMCTNEFDPVCGCDGMDYGNACEANAEGVQVSADQSCECESNSECEASELCNASTCDGPGYCEIRPDLCTLEVDDSRACDGMDYANACLANANGVRAVLD
jgi:hypothetical protein